MHYSESWASQNRINAVEMRSLWNSDVRERCSLKEDVVTRTEESLLQWFEHLERMNESRMAEQICRANVCDDTKVNKNYPKNLMQTKFVVY
ncbi:hypothetical protein EVAR_3836_1 [Eumeta japonica]|uniref:Uncharacterized protein n=1 Tax=Eumeta variegata TaxID=151549 RepID=A0A4C1SQF0_EUMVA|nr:hypothetical protein EVAR_3836_1 [Eumeta japonica]